MAIADPRAAGAAPTAGATAASLAALASCNFFLADVRDGLGPFLGVYLQQRGWAPDDIGYAMTIGGIAGMLATAPLGALADATRAKRALIAVSAALVIAGSLLILFTTGFIATAASQVATGVAGAAIGPALAAVTLGLVGQKGLPRQLGRNEAWNHAGNLFAALLAGGLGYLYGLVAVFGLMGAMALASIVSVFCIRAGEIDHRAARGAGEEQSGPRKSIVAVLLGSRPLLLLALVMMLFHLGNAAMLPLLGQQVAAAGLADPSAFTAATIVIAQLTMIPAALIAARMAERDGYWPLLVVAMAALPVRGLAAAGLPGLWSLLPVQILDGVGAGLLGVALPGLVARILQGTGHINAGLGAVMTVQGVGAALSTSLAGFVAARMGYGAAFMTLTGAALLGLLALFAGGATLRAGAAADADLAPRPAIE